MCAYAYAYAFMQVTHCRILDKIFRFAWHSISLCALRVCLKWVTMIVIAMCHCCCLYFQFSRSEVYSWYVLYSFRKRSDSRLDPIEDVYSHQKQSYSLSLTQYQFSFCSSFRSFVRCVVAFSVYFFFLHFIYFKECLCLFPKLLLIFQFRFALFSK